MLSCLFGRTGDQETSLQTVEEKKKPSKPVFDSTANLCALRGLLQDEKLDYYVVFSTDPHQSEFTSTHDKRLAFLSGFTGEGVAVIGRDEARLFVNGIYWTDAEDNTDSNWTVMKEGSKGVPTWTTFVAGLKDSRLGLDDRLINLSTFNKIRKESAASNVDFILPSENLIEKLWKDQPQLIATELFIQGKELTGKDASDKLADLRKNIKAAGGSAYLVYDLPEIAWLLNLRASDQPTTPVFYSYALITESETLLFVRLSQINDKVAKYLEDIKVKIHPYENVRKILAQYEFKDAPCLVASTIPYFLPRTIGESNVKIADSPIAERRAIKNKVELAGMREAYLQDATAWCKWLAWLEDSASAHAGPRLTEYECGQKLVQFAKQQPNYFCPSYDPLFQCGANGAKPHYAPTKDKTDVVDFSKMIVSDIGFNWRNGTCDTTRTLHMNSNKATKQEKRAFTRVLQGHIAVDQAHFPASQGNGASLDALARQFLWQDGLQFQHGTGHGIGSFLNVHEIPPMISAKSQKPFSVGNVMSNEPGFYLAETFGTRTESVIAVTEVQTKYNWGDDKWLGFERLTRVPIQKSLVDWSVMTAQDKKWLHDHNELCKLDMKDRLKSDKRALKWLLKQ